jgi:hypothetical protein
VDKFLSKIRNRLAATMQLHDILCLVIYFGQGKKLYTFTAMDREAQRFMLLPL